MRVFLFEIDLFAINSLPYNKALMIWMLGGKPTCSSFWKKIKRNSFPSLFIKSTRTSSPCRSSYREWHSHRHFINFHIVATITPGYKSEDNKRVICILGSLFIYAWGVYIALWVLNSVIYHFKTFKMSLMCHSEGEYYRIFLAE